MKDTEYYLTSNSNEASKETVWIINRKDGLRIGKTANRKLAEEVFQRITRRPGNVIDIRKYLR